MSATLKAATPDDIEGMLQIEALCFSDPWSRVTFSFFLNSKAHFSVLCENEQVIGYAVTELADAEAGELLNIAIAPTARQKGYSRILMDDLIKAARQQNKKKIWLEVRESNTPAVSLYESYGFKADGVRKNYYHNPTENGLLMTLDL